MKLLATLVLLAAAIGGWYCYEKFYSGAESSFKAAERDARIADIDAISKELFPTDKSGRERWRKGQIAALRLIDSSCAALDGNAKSAILQDAAKKFPRDYDKRLSYIQKQEVFARDFASKLGGSGMAPEDSAALATALSAEFGGDYESQCMRMDDVISCIGRIESIKRQMSPEDFKKISARVMSNLARDPRGTENFLYSQFLARHNYLSKSIPIQLGDLRKGIEESFPDDFIAQERELNSRLESVFKKGASEAESINQKKDTFSIERYKKAFSMSVSMCGKTKYAGFFVRMNGKRVYIFPFEALEDLKEKTFEVDGKVFSMDKVFVSEDSSFCIVMADEGEGETLEFKSASDGESQKCAVAYFDSRGVVNVLSASISGDKLSFNETALNSIKYMALNGGLVLDAKTAQPIALLEVYGNAARDCYERYLSNGGLEAPLTNVFPANAMPKSIDAFKKNIGVVRVDKLVEIRALVPTSIEKGKWRAFSADKYALQSEALGKASSIIWNAQKFMFDNSFQSVFNSDIFSKAARKYEKTFLSGSRLHKSVFYSQYASYIRELILAGRLAWDSSGILQYGDFYRPYRDMAAKQNALWNDILLCLNDAMKNSDLKEYIHRDLFANIRGEAYVPAERKLEQSGGGGGGGFNFVEGFYRKKTKDK